jgi:hypothetical protein
MRGGAGPVPRGRQAGWPGAARRRPATSSLPPIYKPPLPNSYFTWICLHQKLVFIFIIFILIWITFYLRVTNPFIEILENPSVLTF